MEKKQVDLGGRFNNAFGFISTNNTQVLQETKISVNGATVFVKDGRSSYENFVLRGKNGVELKFCYSGLNSQPADVFAPPCLVTFKKSKRIDETIVSNNDANGTELQFGQVVENYGSKPIDISIKGLLIDFNNRQYPSDKVNQLNEMFNYNGIWIVEGQIFADHKVKSIYFTDMDSQPVQGFMDTWSFSLEARSIQPVEFFMKK